MLKTLVVKVKIDTDHEGAWLIQRPRVCWGSLEALPERF